MSFLVACRHSDALCKEMEGFDVQSLDEVSAYMVMDLKMFKLVCFYIRRMHMFCMFMQITLRYTLQYICIRKCKY